MASYFFIWLLIFFITREIIFTDLAEGWSRVTDVFSGVIYMSTMKFSTQIGRDSRGRFKKIINPFVLLPEITKEALIG